MSPLSMLESNATTGQTTEHVFGSLRMARTEANNASTVAPEVVQIPTSSRSRALDCGTSRMAVSRAFAAIATGKPLLSLLIGSALHSPGGSRTRSSRCSGARYAVVFAVWPAGGDPRPEAGQSQSRTLPPAGQLRTLHLGRSPELPRRRAAPSRPRGRFWSAQAGAPTCPRRFRGTSTPAGDQNPRSSPCTDTHHHPA